MESIDKMFKYYKSEGMVTLIGLNDSQLIDVVNPYSKGSFDLIVDAFEERNIPTLALNAGSSFYNKAEHAKAMIEADLTVDEIKLLNSYSALAAYSKVVRDSVGFIKFFERVSKSPFSLPKSFEKLIRPAFNTGELGETKLSNFLALKPVIITSFMANNIMRAVANDPYNIKKHYAQRDTNPHFNYTLSKINDPKVLKGIVELTKRTYDTLLSHTNGDLYGIGFFLPKGMAAEEGFKAFEEYIDMCNQTYSELCQSLGVHYVDVSKLGATTGTVDFHASPVQIKNAVIAEMANHTSESKDTDCFSIPPTSYGLDYIINGAKTARDQADQDLNAYEDDFVLANTAYERSIELKIAQSAGKAYTKIKNNRN